ncbi:MAG: hypothetical protein C0599_13185 [Salinivirgaceae bacterium]|nr:MAG: hypothetical protein C0599_13185 [Salinivirgaceae bacterium]
MKLFTKLFIVGLLAILSFEVSAQSMLYKGGLNISSMLEKDADYEYSSDYGIMTGFHIGAGFELPINEMFSVEPNFIFTSKGADMTFEDPDFGLYSYEGTVKTYYIDVPIYFKASYDLGFMKAYAAAGPYFGIGVAGKIDLKTQFLGEEIITERDVNWGYDETYDDYKTVDMGVSFGAGAEIGAFVAGFYYDFGLSNNYPQDINDLKTNNRVIRVSLGYKLDLAKKTEE